MVSWRVVAVSVAMLSTSLVAATPALALSKSGETVTSLSCVFTMPVALDARSASRLSGGRDGGCADGALAPIVLAPETLILSREAIMPASVVEAFDDEPVRRSVPLPPFEAEPERRVSIGIGIVDHAPPSPDGFFPGRVQPIPPSPVR